MDEYYDFPTLKPLLSRANILPEPKLQEYIEVYQRYTDERAIELILGSVVLFIVDKAIKYKKATHSPVELSDLVGEALAVLPNAVKKFDSDKENNCGIRSKFISYYSWWMRAAFSSADTAERNEKGIFWVSGNENRILGYEYAIKRKIDKKKNVRYINYLSLQKPVRGENKTVPLGEIIAAPNTTEYKIEKAELKRRVENAVNSLNDRYKNVLALRYGMFGHNSHNLKEVGKIVNLTRERVRQICDKAIKEARPIAMNKRLYDFLQ